MVRKSFFKKKEQFYHLFRRGAHYFKNSKEEKAFEDFEKALSIAPNIDKAVHIYLERANHFYTKQKYQEALEDYLQFFLIFLIFFLRLYDLYELNGVYFYRLGVCYYQTKDYASAVENFDISYKLCPFEITRTYLNLCIESISLIK
jgi:tetratricopeptide (TPR) repeat protein